MLRDRRARVRALLSPRAVRTRAPRRRRRRHRGPLSGESRAEGSRVAAARGTRSVTLRLSEAPAASVVGNVDFSHRLRVRADDRGLRGSHSRPASLADDAAVKEATHHHQPPPPRSPPPPGGGEDVAQEVATDYFRSVSPAFSFCPPPPPPLAALFLPSLSFSLPRGRPLSRLPLYLYLSFSLRVARVNRRRRVARLPPPVVNATLRASAAVREETALRSASRRAAPRVNARKQVESSLHFASG